MLSFKKIQSLCLTEYRPKPTALAITLVVIAAITCVYKITANYRGDSHEYSFDFIDRYVCVVWSIFAVVAT
jgi:hypothetical protein